MARSDTSQSELLPTRQSLLSRLRDWDDQESWRHFFDLYWKLLHGMARERGLNEQEAQEVVQETVIAVAKNMPGFRYQPERCSFKSFLRHLLEKKVADAYRRRARASQNVAIETGDDSALEPIDQLATPREEAPDVVWEKHWQQHLFDAAVERVKAKTNVKHFQIFHRLVVLGHGAGEVARTLDVNIAQVYLAKHRVTGLMKKELAALRSELEREQRR